MSKTNNIPTFTCPDFSFSSSNKTKYNGSDNDPTKRLKLDQITETEDIKSLHHTIKKFNASELKGKERIKLKQDQLSELGAPPPKCLVDSICLHHLYLYCFCYECW